MNLNQVTVKSHDIEASKAFYQKLGLILIVDTPHYLRFECPEGDGTFSVSLTDAPPPEGVRDTTVYFEFKEGELDKRVAELEAEGMEFLHPVTDQRWLWRETHTIDPSGNKICLFYGGENRKNPPWRVN